MLGLIKAARQEKTHFTTPMNLHRAQNSTEPELTLFAAINIKCREFANRNDYIELNGEALEDHWFETLKSNPNPNLNWWGVKYLAAWWYHINGNAYLYTPIDNGLPYAVYNLPSTQVRPIATSERVTAYKFDYQSGSITIPAEEMIHFKSMHPSVNFAESHFQGQPWQFEKSLQAMNVEKESLDFVQSFLKNDAVPPFILSSDDTITSTELKRQKEGFNTSISNPKYQVQAMISHGMKVQSLGNAPAASGIADKQINAVENKICTIQEVPKRIIEMEFNGKAHALEGWKFWQDGVINTLTNNFDFSVTQWGQGFEDTFEYVIEDYTFDNEESQREWERHDLLLGLRSPNEILEARGEDRRVPHGDNYYTDTLMPLSDSLPNETGVNG